MNDDQSKSEEREAYRILVTLENVCLHYSSLNGIGLMGADFGASALIPTITLVHDGEGMVIDGLTFKAELTPDERHEIEVLMNKIIIRAQRDFVKRFPVSRVGE